jgi:hypothetical protein
MSIINNLSTSEIDNVSGGSPDSRPGLILIGPAILAWIVKALAEAISAAQLSAGGTSDQ